MGQEVSRTDFEWVYTEEPHKTRRKQILAKYPEVKSLMGHDPWMRYIVITMVLVQILVAFLLRDASWTSVIIAGYCIGGMIDHSLAAAIHEISHNLAFGHSKPLLNRLLGMLANLPLGIPLSVSFKKYHLEHHRYQGDDEKDVDIPSRIEARLFHNTFTKFLWVIMQPFFYALRPLFIRPKPVTTLEIVNAVAQVIFNVVIVYTMGYKSLGYFILGNLLSMGLHPVAGHFISEHYMFKKGYETYSYYGPLNFLVYNVGYHNEHHDFPNIPGCNLPKLKEMVPEYYNNLPCHYSWSRVIYDFIMDPAIGPYARVKRKQIPFPGQEESDDDLLPTDTNAERVVANDHHHDHGNRTNVEKVVANDDKHVHGNKTNDDIVVTNDNSSDHSNRCNVDNLVVNDNNSNHGDGTNINNMVSRDNKGEHEKCD